MLRKLHVGRLPNQDPLYHCLETDSGCQNPHISQEEYGRRQHVRERLDRHGPDPPDHPPLMLLGHMLSAKVRPPADILERLWPPLSCPTDNTSYPQHFRGRQHPLPRRSPRAFGHQCRRASARRRPLLPSPACLPQSSLAPHQANEASNFATQMFACTHVRSNGRPSFTPSPRLGVLHPPTGWVTLHRDARERGDQEALLFGVIAMMRAALIPVSGAPSPFARSSRSCSADAAVSGDVSGLSCSPTPSC